MYSSTLLSECSEMLEQTEPDSEPGGAGHTAHTSRSSSVSVSMSRELRFCVWYSCWQRHTSDVSTEHSDDMPSLAKSLAHPDAGLTGPVGPQGAAAGRGASD